jgi:5'-3' exoribonuclease 2
VFREAPEFLESSIPIQVRGGDSNAPYFLDIRELSRRILDEMGCKYNDEHRLHDYVFLCFLLGNDFLPHFPAMNIRTHGIQALLDLYRMYIGSAPDRFFISKHTGKIEWKNVKLFIGEVAKREHEFLLNEYGVRAKWDRRTFPETTEKEKEDLLTNVPMVFRQEEKYICPEEEGWESRYYKCLFRIDKDTTKDTTKEDIRRVCVNYLEGLEWVYSYYTTGCLDWTWKYHYAYPPLFVDLFKHIPESDVSLFVKDNAGQRPLSPFAQLAYVLPSAYLTLLPDNMRAYLVDSHSELYLEDYRFQWAFCRYFWESHPLLPEVSFDRLSEIDTALVGMA